MTRGTSLRWLGWLPVVVVFNNHLYTLQTVSGRSMQPTLNPDSSPWRDIALFDRTMTATGHKCQRGDVVALRSPVVSQVLLVKRILALEGDVVQTLSPYPERQVVVPEGYVWVEGDERFLSQDSNHFGPVALIDAKLAFIIWPLPRFGPLRRPRIEGGARVPMSSPLWRATNDDIIRERWRTARVQPAQPRKDFR